jgi:8-oxo-dGTP diphosphatase
VTRPFPAVAAAVIVEREGVLLVRRRIAEGALVWQFPGGKLEPGESAEAAAVAGDPGGDRANC